MDLSTKLHYETILLFHDQLGMGITIKPLSNFTSMTIFSRIIIEPGMLISIFLLITNVFMISRLVELAQVDSFVRSQFVTKSNLLSSLCKSQHGNLGLGIRNITFPIKNEM